MSPPPYFIIAEDSNSGCYCFRGEGHTGNTTKVFKFHYTSALRHSKTYRAILSSTLTSGHYKKKHILQGLIIGILHTGVLFFLLSVFLNSRGLYDAFRMEQTSIYAGLLFFGLLYTPLELLLSIVLQMVSRKNEREADRFAAETVAEPESMIDALKKLSANNLSNLSPHPFYVFLNYSHPPLLERVQAIQGQGRQPNRDT